MTKIDNVKCERVFYHFEEINKIPRGSGNEKAISDYLLNFGQKLGLVSIQDDALNIIIKKPASKGYENAPCTIIQGHMDMVCEKNNDTEHDFTKDPIKLIVKGDYIYADGTTLGGDDGIAVAYAMAILEDNTLEHPALEVLITTDEEAGMSGAMAINPEHIDGKIVLNLDSEEEGKLLVSCAGGIRTKSTLPVEWIDKKEGTTNYVVEVKGLKGGHSGVDIHLGKGNSNKIIARVLKRISNEVKFNLASLNGGSKNNAIPREAVAVITAAKADEAAIFNIVSTVEAELKEELRVKDPDVKVTVTEYFEDVKKVFSDDSTAKAIGLLYIYPNGVNTVSSEIEGLTESSTNIGVVTTTEDSVEFDSAVRSSVLTLRDEIVERNKCTTEAFGGTFTSNAGYPAWPYRVDSPIRDLCKDIYTRMYGKEPEIVAIHAGVECGLFKEKLGDLDMISFGPDIFDIHTPDEHLSISSVERTWEYLLEILKGIK